MAYLILSHPGGVSAEAFAALKADLRQRDWTLAFETYGLAVLTLGLATRVHAVGDWRGAVGVVVGDLFDRAAADAGEGRSFALASLDGLADLRPVALAQALARRAFGDYVGLLRHRHSGQPAVFSDPIGARQAFAWTREGVTLVGDLPPEGLAAPRDVRLDWERLGQIMADRRRAHADPPLTGVTWITPGTCRFGPDLGEVATIWTPARVARSPNRRPDPAALRQTIDGAVQALALDQDQILCELSGGLDSAIVATSLRAGGRSADLAFNFYRGQAEADERIYAQAAAARAGTPLRCIARQPWSITPDALTRGPRSFRPNFELFDTDFDRLALEIIEETKAQAVFTGHGGDVVFYQLGADHLAADLLRGAPCHGPRLHRLADIARRNRRSVWSLAAQTLRGRPSKAVAALMRAPMLLTTGKPAGPAHPWTTDLSGVLPAKRAQIASLAISQGLFSVTRRGAAARLRHPLFSQPVVEACLKIPATLLSQGEGDRSLAREAFAARLPESIVQRRSKGDISVFLGRTLALNTPTLRAFLLEGALAAHGVIDTTVLETLLHPETLIHRDVYGEILCATVLEAFARTWEEGRRQSHSGLG